MWQHLHLVERLPASQPNFDWIESQKLWRWLWAGIIAMVRMTPILAEHFPWCPKKASVAEEHLIRLTQGTAQHSKAVYILHGSLYTYKLYSLSLNRVFVHFTACTTHCKAKHRTAQKSNSTAKHMVNTYHRKAVVTLVLQCWTRAEGGKAGGRSKWNADAPFLDDTHALRLDHYNPLTYIFIVIKFKEIKFSMNKQSCMHIAHILVQFWIDIL